MSLYCLCHGVDNRASIYSHCEEACTKSKHCKPSISHNLQSFCYNVLLEQNEMEMSLLSSCLDDDKSLSTVTLKCA